MPEKDTDMDKSLGDKPKETGGATQSLVVLPTYVIAIGIDRYGDKNVVKNFENGNCERDCTDFIKVLKDKFDKVNVYDAPLTNEQATKPNIEQLFMKFIDSEFNNLDNNIIIYFSGHGGMVKQGLGQIGSWIPHGIDELNINKVMPYNWLASLFNQFCTRNVLIIADACNSGSIFKELKGQNDPANTGDKIDGEISRWCIASCRSNENSKAGGPGQNSLFTRHLLDILKKHPEKNISVSTIISKIEDRFLNDPPDQQPFSGRLQFQDIHNTGSFVLSAIDNVFNIMKRTEILSGGLVTLNYKEQKTAIRNFANEIGQINDKPKKQIAILSGTKNCGLKLLSLSVTKSWKKNSEATELPPAIFPGTGSTEDERLVNVFNACLKRSFPDKDTLMRYLENDIAKKNIIIQLRFYNDHAFDDDAKSLQVKEIAEFLFNIKYEAGNEKNILLVIVDEEKCNYEDKFNKAAIEGINTFYLPIPTVLDDDQLSEWYTEIRDNYSQFDDNKINEFNLLFDNCLEKNIKDIIMKTQGFPGSVIELICEETECSELAKKYIQF